MVTAVLLGVSLHGNAAMPVDADTMAKGLTADYRVLSGSVPPGMIAGDIVIEARFPIDGLQERTLTAILKSLPPAADAIVVSDRYHGSRWLHICCPSGADTIYGNAFTILSALEPAPLDAVQLSLNARWDAGTLYSIPEKKDFIKSFFSSIEARAVASMADERIVSASGFSPRLSGRTGAGADAMNITASLCSDGAGGGSTLWLGTPVLTVEY